MLDRRTVARRVGGCRNGGEIRLRLRELGRQRVVHFLVTGARAIPGGFPRRDRVVPHRLLRRVEIQLSLERSDAHQEVAAALTAVAMMQLGSGDAGDADEGCGGDSREARSQSSGHDHSSCDFVPFDAWDDPGDSNLMLGPHCRRPVRPAGGAFATGRCARSVGDTITYIRRTTIARNVRSNLA